MKKFNVHIPDESYVILQYRIKDSYAIGVVNTSLKDFEPKEVFAWHLSVIIEFKELAENGMPTPEENEFVNSFGDELDLLIKGPDLEKPNALFLAKETWNKTRELIWRVFDPEVIHNSLQKIIKNNSSPRAFEYEMEHDEEWELTKWFLQDRHVNK